jgi:hypothetical protein
LAKSPNSLGFENSSSLVVWSKYHFSRFVMLDK